MRSLIETRTRWDETLKQSSSLADLQRAVKFNGPSSPCVAGCRSVCWKAFLLFQGAASDNWAHTLDESRSAYAALQDHYLKYIKHPEQLAELSLDPLADDPESPWNAIRRDELVRSEILQDVQRLPDEPFYREPTTQTLILDILFIYCKLNPDVGGYRQGMHELLAPIVYVIHQDAIDRAALTLDDHADPVMLQMLDSSFIEHDAFALFSNLMAHAKPFYEVGAQNGAGPEQNAIVVKSRQIHEVSLRKIDPELSEHLKNIEVLPQIFLIRWIRLLFGREFPFEQLLVLWDTIFAFDPSLDLIDLICVAMLIRIRWTLLEADYSIALQLLLKYPAPQPPHGPHTFVDDALYLRGHLNAAGGANLILKYTGKSPASWSTGSRPSTPTTFHGISLRQRTLGPRSPLSSTARLIQQQGGVEALFQGAAKGVLERGEKLGINQAVRGAMGEIRRNMHGLQEARGSARATSSGRDPFTDGRAVSPAATVALLEGRNRQLAAMLDEAVASLKSLAASKLEGEKEKQIEAVELAAAKVQFVKVYLEDSSLALPDDAPPSPPNAATTSLTLSFKENIPPTVALDTTEVTTTTAAVVDAMADLKMPSSEHGEILEGSFNVVGQPPLSPIPDTPIKATAKQDENHDHDRMETDSPVPSPVPTANSDTALGEQRPRAPIPTRSTLAQSSFAWMLEPDTAPSASTMTTLSSSAPLPHRVPPGGRRGNSASREKNAFLFGEVVTPEAAAAGERTGRGLSADEIFGLQPIRKGKGF